MEGGNGRPATLEWSDQMNRLARYEPLVGQLDGLFNEFFRPAFVWDQRAETAPVRVDVREDAAGYTVHAELPGVKKEDIPVEIEGNEVTIAADVKRGEDTKEGEKVLRTERFYGRTARRFALPHEVDEGKAEAKFTDGVLELKLPKKAQVTGRKIAVQ
jgi:HSP20 family protein